MRRDLWSVEVEGASLGLRRGADSVIIGMMDACLIVDLVCEDQLLKD